VDDEPDISSALGPEAVETAQQRELLLDAAAQIFAVKGFAGTSADEIAAAAGLPVQALHAHFAGLDELLIDVLTSRIDQRVTEAGWLVKSVAGDRAEVAAALSRLLVVVADQDADTAALRAELWLHAVQNPEAMARVAARWRAFDAVVADVARAQFARHDPGFDVPADGLATVLTALFEGLVRRRRADPEAVPDDLFGNALRWLVAGVRTTADPTA
jgi:AcrR family transcriptional regulator